ncbi:hypothetical protein [Streptomyces sp. NPDC007100]|uniref:hypothetical protein n=1 Tax=Streptomyces sp. NPDC007100 TaxID=3155602 RepID=UPI0033CDAD43
MSTATQSPHGERRCYLRGCRRPECIAANKRYCKTADLRRHREGPRRIDGTDAANHLRRLIDEEGWTQIGIADTLGISRDTVGGLASGRNKTCRREDARRILAFQPDFDAERPSPRVDIVGSTRRLQALAVLGHALYDVSAETGVSYAVIRRILRGEGRYTSKDFAARIRRVYEQRRHTNGPSYITRGHARAKGWYGPDAWRDIDDPQCTPHENRRHLAALRRADVEHLAGFGISEHEIAARLGMASAYVHDLIRDMRSAA